jgi:hypothetical protein
MLSSKSSLINININCSKVGTVYVYLLSNFQFYNNLLKVAICRIFTQRTRSLDSGSLYKGSNARENKGSRYMEGVAKTSLTVCGRDFNIFLPIFILLITVYEFLYGEMHFQLIQQTLFNIFHPYQLCSIFDRL